MFDPADSSTVILPPALQPGSRIGVVAPASGVSRWDIRDGVEALKSFGCKVELGKTISSVKRFLSISDEARAADFMEFVARDDIDAIVCARGGYGVMRILPLLDYEMIRAKPKIVVGYSDITALVNAIYVCSGVVAYHGPVVYSTFDPYTKEYFHKTLFRPEPVGRIKDSNEFNSHRFSNRRLVTLAGGKAQGRLVGGNLTLVASTLGTPYEVQCKDAILFFEDVSEEPYKIDRMLTQLWLAGKLQECSGIAMGRFRKCDVSTNPYFPHSLEEVLRTRLEPLGVPIVYGLPIGHVKSKMTVPVGTMAELDADEGRLSLIEASVRERDS